MTLPLFNCAPTEPFVLPDTAIEWPGFPIPTYREVSFQHFVYERNWHHDDVVPLGAMCWMSRDRRIALIMRGMGKGPIDIQLDGENLDHRLDVYEAAILAVDAMHLADEMANIGPV